MTVFIKVASALSDGIFRIGLRGKITDPLKKPWMAMCLKYRLRQEVDNCRMNLPAHQHHVRRRDEADVCSRNLSRQINSASGQYQANEIRENTGEGLRLRKAH